MVEEEAMKIGMSKQNEADEWEERLRLTPSSERERENGRAMGQSKVNPQR